MTEQRSYIGKNAIKNLSEIVKSYNPRTIMLVRGHDSYVQSGAEELIGRVIRQDADKVIEFKDFSINPKMEEAEIGTRFLEANKTDLIIAVGGGSALDVAKAMRLFYSFDEDETGTLCQKRNLIPLIAVPTTAGTGSEATHFSVLYKDGEKYSVAHPSMLPDVAIVDPVFTFNIPAYLTACTGFDALAQAIEAYWNVHATDESDVYAAEAIPNLVECLPLLLADGSNAKLRERVSVAAYRAGQAINITKTTAPHAFSYSFTTYYGFPHGHAVALTIPYFLQFNYTDKQDLLHSALPIGKHLQKMLRLYGWLGIANEEQAEASMRNFIEKLGLAFQLPPDFDPILIQGNVNAERLGNNPRNMAKPDIKDVVDYLCRFKQEDFSEYNGEGTTLRKAQLRLLEILSKVDEICRRHNIPYWLDFGTLLGAVRHNGFIPWDDDLDIAVMRKDYKRFRKIMIKELPEQFFFSDWTTDAYHFDNYARIKDTRSHFPYPLFAKQKVQGVYLEVFLLDYVTSVKTRNFLNFFQRRIWRTLHRFDDAAGTPFLRKTLNKIIAWVSYPFMSLVLFIYQGIAKLKKDRKVSYLCCLPGQYPHIGVFSEEDILPCSEVIFEGKRFMAPTDTDKYLRILYNNYMKVPDKDKRLGHVLNMEIFD